MLVLQDDECRQAYMNDALKKNLYKHPIIYLRYVRILNLFVSESVFKINLHGLYLYYTCVLCFALLEVATLCVILFQVG